MDDLNLAEMVLRSIRENRKLKEGFEEVSEKIGRTTSACANRWNSFLKYQYQAAIQIAKAQADRKRQMK
ncbi:hypothetical protein BC351_00795 [Paenibacillus ferrarius]|uniref:Myb-like domain-containing protein n=1 Tax=Paenibacillus ferrarius TaxID=1469647 RepID=A0A1V4HSB2_9BACL|nr:hypothetical protein BC351_00795 [Paenibacillus ferrarius]